MFDAYIGEVNLGVATLALSVVLVLPVQYWLCRAERTLFVRLLPTIIFAVGTAVCVLLAHGAQDWDGIFYILFACYCAMLLGASALGWLIWAVVRAWRRRGSVD